ncbi:MAG: peptide-methionine (S)-S-oxide reductase MsrA [Pseudomonadota bacterium]
MLATIHQHHVNGADMFGDYPAGSEQALFGMGCFWGVERIFWKLDGVHVTSVGYAGGSAPDPDYKSVCSGRTGHAEVAHIVFDPDVITYEELLKVFFENHDPTQGNRQGNDVGSQYRSAIYTYSDEQAAAARDAKARYEAAYGRPVTTEIAPAPKCFPAEDYHQQYLAKNPQGYCNHGPTGVSCPIPQRTEAAE